MTEWEYTARTERGKVTHQVDRREKITVFWVLETWDISSKCSGKIRPALHAIIRPNPINWRTYDLAAPTEVKVLESGSKCKMCCTPSSSSYLDVTENVFGGSFICYR